MTKDKKEELRPCPFCGREVLDGGEEVYCHHHFRSEKKMLSSAYCWQELNKCNAENEKLKEDIKWRKRNWEEQKDYENHLETEVERCKKVLKDISSLKEPVYNGERVWSTTPIARPMYKILADEILGSEGVEG